MNCFTYVILGIGLLICTVTDLYYKIIYPQIVLVVDVLLVALRVTQGNLSVQYICGAVLIGVCFIILSVITRYQIGVGDALVFIMIWLGVGVFGGLLVICISFQSAFIAAIFLVVVRKKHKDYRMPFVPFMTGSYIIYLLAVV